LLASTIHSASRGTRLEAIPGSPPNLSSAPTACTFAPRCRYADAACRAGMPGLEPVTPSRAVRCVHADTVAATTRHIPTTPQRESVTLTP
jgi:peptide/nickel transport system ATP-binding protein